MLDPFKWGRSGADLLPVCLVELDAVVPRQVLRRGLDEADLTHVLRRGLGEADLIHILRRGLGVVVSTRMVLEKTDGELWLGKTRGLPLERMEETELLDLEALDDTRGNFHWSVG